LSVRGLFIVIMHGQLFALGLAVAAAACAPRGALASRAAAVPSVALRNAAAPGQTMPFIGLGTGGYGSALNPYNAYPECWMEIVGCGNHTVEAVKMWLALGGRRLDAADSYDTQVSVGAAMAESGVARDEIFLLQKTGSWNPMGFNDTLSQFSVILAQMNTSYVDLLLNHWPTSPASPTIDPLCDPKKPATYDAKACRLSTWRAYVEIWQSGGARAIGVANYAISDIQEIIDAGMPLPALNQVPYHLYNAAAQQPLKAFCEAHNIVLLSYSPLGIPDWHAFPTPALPSNSTLSDPVVLATAAAHAPATPAQVLLAWLFQQGMPSNPRSMSAEHMRDNLDVFGSGLVLSDAEMAALSSRPIDFCSADNDFYECVPNASFVPAPHPWAVRRA
jgi:2,5-diketo-D-gluconate reductase A